MVQRLDSREAGAIAGIDDISFYSAYGFPLSASSVASPNGTTYAPPYEQLPTSVGFGVPSRRIACDPDRDLRTRVSVILIRLPHRPRVRPNPPGRKILRQIAGSLAFRIRFGDTR